MSGHHLRWSVVAWCLLLMADGFAQRVEPFAVASIKHNVSGVPYGQSADRPDGLTLVNERLRDIILFAFDIRDFQLAGAPEWIGRERFDVSARADGPLTTDDKRARLRQLLAERFGLRVTTELREQAVYVLARVSGASARGLTARDCAASGAFPLPCGRGLAAADGGAVRMAGIPMTVTIVVLDTISPLTPD